MMDMKTGRWAEKILESLGLSSAIMPPVITPGTVVGKLTDEISSQIGCKSIPVIAVASHDTASAVAAIPAGEDYSWAYLSSGTWSLLGAQISSPVINDKTYQFQFTNEGGVGGTIRLLKNIMGLWLVQQCRSQWQQDGQELSYSQLTDLAEKAEPFTEYINPSHNPFLSPGNMPQKINDYLIQTSRRPIQDKGRMIRSILESLALNYSFVLEQVEDIIDKKVDCLHIVGGGIKNELLCQFTANATGKIVFAGPIEATAAGNILLQALATGQIHSLKQIRRIVRNSFDLKEYRPQDIDVWKKQSNLIRDLYR
jgi:rhamnulokinase